MAKREIDIEEQLFPNHGELVADENGSLSALIVDEELDGYNCDFNNDNCVQINTKGYDWITLSKTQLHNLMLLIEEAEERYDEMNDQES